MATLPTPSTEAPGKRYTRPRKPWHWRGKQHHHGGGVCDLCVLVHGNVMEQQGNRRHNNGDGRHDDGRHNNWRHNDGKWQQGDRQHNDSGGGMRMGGTMMARGRKRQQHHHHAPTAEPS